MGGVVEVVILAADAVAGRFNGFLLFVLFLTAGNFVVTLRKMKDARERRTGLSGDV